MRTTVLYLVLIAACSGLIRCSKPDMTVFPPPGTTEVNNISDYLNNQLSLSLFAEAAQLAGLSEDLATAEYTVFAVNDEAFHRIGITTAADLQRWPTDSLETFVQQHMIQGRLLYGDIPRSLDTEYSTVNGETLLISYHSEELTTVNGVRMIENPRASNDPRTFGTPLQNGMVYPIQTPIKTTTGTVQDFLASRPELSLFVAGLKKFGQWDRLATEQQITVLAPPDSVFLRYGIDADRIVDMDAQAFQSLLMDAYIVNFNRIFTNDVQTQINEIDYPNTSSANMLFLRTSDPETGLAVVNEYQSYTGTFLFKPGINEPMVIGPGQPPFWATRIIGSNRLSVPNPSDVNTGYVIAYLGEARYTSASELTGRYMNFNCANGVVHYIDGLLVMPEEAIK
ncbi:fasciclin domain-containing protein [Parapedobacter tibetensis]|uniref:fasciclin domain-containing protein n=1 Tax=Parapedobacter tibetensis TaxID=2972951 RepID=UPI00214D5637|nr:fasciclin domain-containing protein [Parapedobacter tibetensis]